MPEDLVKLVNRVKKDSEEFWLSPTQWRKSTVPSTLIWDFVRFTRTEAADVPASRGVYAFLVAFSPAGFPPHGYPMYIGETGNDGQETLHSRFVSYFREMEEQSRPVHYVLNKYKRYLYFHFSEVTDKRRNLKKLEKALCDTLIPPYNVRDFSAEMRNAKPAF
jgi:hypothetical protein